MRFETEHFARPLALAGALLALVGLALAAAPAASAAVAGQSAPRVLIVFLPGQLKAPPPPGAVGSAPRLRAKLTVTEQLAAHSQLSIGLSSPVQGRYRAA
ncbi:MAG: hypothetical protein JHD03_05015, partial [Solirubrobacteraceae bacterium]|nr:hypothetical protein [Solirubrobacteraceae bacterium]MBJ7342966.1 hypothetical protein [Solirubrobacteraceae bacterium]